MNTHITKKEMGFFGEVVKAGKEKTKSEELAILAETIDREFGTDILAKSVDEIKIFRDILGMIIKFKKRK